MSQNAKVAVAVVVVLVLAGAAYYWYQQMHPVSSTTFLNTPATAPSGSDTSDKGLQQDTAAIDAQMKGLSNDQATVNSSVNAN